MILIRRHLSLQIHAKHHLLIVKRQRHIVAAVIETGRCRQVAVFHSGIFYACDIGKRISAHLIDIVARTFDGDRAADRAYIARRQHPAHVESRQIHLCVVMLVLEIYFSVGNHFAATGSGAQDAAGLLVAVVNLSFQRHRRHVDISRQSKCPLQIAAARHAPVNVDSATHILWLHHVAEPALELNVEHFRNTHLHPPHINSAHRAARVDAEVHSGAAERLPQRLQQRHNLSGIGK